MMTNHSLITPRALRAINRGNLKKAREVRRLQAKGLAAIQALVRPPRLLAYIERQVLEFDERQHRLECETTEYRLRRAIEDHGRDRPTTTAFVLTLATQGPPS